jgi:hypothetical protein
MPNDFVMPDFGAPGAMPATDIDGFVMPSFEQEALPKGAPPQQPGFEPGFGDYAQQVLGQGTLMGHGDEISAAIRAGYQAAMEGKPLVEAYKQNLSQVRSDMAQTEKSLGTLGKLGLQGSGALLTGALGAGRMIVGKGLDLGAKMLIGGKYGFGQGAATGYGMSEKGTATDPLGTLQDIGLGAGVGLVGGAVFPGIGHGIQKGTQAVGRIIPGGVNRQAAGVVQGTIPRREVAGLERKVMGDPLSVVADYAPVDAQRAAGAAVRSIGGGPQANFLRARQASQDLRVLPQIARQVSDEGAASKISSLGEARRALAQKNYGEVYETEVRLTDTLKGFFQKDLTKEAYKMAKKIANNEGIDLPPLYTKTDAGAVYAQPTARMLDYLKQGMDAIVEKEFKKSGTMGTSAKGVRDQFRDHLDDIIPGYQNARSTYAGQSAAMEAVENGRKFMTSLGDEKSALAGFGKADVAKMGDHELEAFRAGAASVLVDKIKAKGPMADITKLFESRGAKEKMNALLGKAGAREFRKTINSEAAKAKTFAELTGTQTSQRESARGSVLNYIPQAVAGGDPTTMLLQGAINKVAPQPEDVSRVIARLLASPKAADKAEAFRIMKSGAISRPLSYGGGMFQGSTSGIGGYLGGAYGAQE